MPVAATFVTEVEGKAMLGQVARLDTLVTLVDGKNFFETYGTTERRRDEVLFF
jgi:G3E family GTPase